MGLFLPPPQWASPGTPSSPGRGGRSNPALLPRGPARRAIPHQLPSALPSGCSERRGLTSASSEPWHLAPIYVCYFCHTKKHILEREKKIGGFCQVGFEPAFTPLCSALPGRASGTGSSRWKSFARGFLMVLSLCSIYTPKHACSSVIYLGIFKL